jgi:hypothetical protein
MNSENFNQSLVTSTPTNRNCRSRREEALTFLKAKVTRNLPKTFETPHVVSYENKE